MVDWLQPIIVCHLSQHAAHAKVIRGPACKMQLATCLPNPKKQHSYHPCMSMWEDCRTSISNLRVTIICERRHWHHLWSAAKHCSQIGFVKQPPGEGARGWLHCYTNSTNNQMFLDAINVFLNECEAQTINGHWAVKVGLPFSLQVSRNKVSVWVSSRHMSVHMTTTGVIHLVWCSWREDDGCSFTEMK